MTHPYVDRLGLRAHPEGGWFTETWRVGTELDTARGRRATATGIHGSVAFPAPPV